MREVITVDGRTLAVEEWGDPTGTAVIYLHGTPVSRLARYPTIACSAGSASGWSPMTGRDMAGPPRDAGSNAAAVDWRADYEALTYTPLPDVPASVRAGVSALMGRLGLRFGTFDFIVTLADRWIFLEINPNGQWAWIEDATGLPIAASIADALTEGDR